MIEMTIENEMKVVEIFLQSKILNEWKIEIQQNAERLHLGLAMKIRT